MDSDTAASRQVLSQDLDPVHQDLDHPGDTSSQFSRLLKQEILEDGSVRRYYSDGKRITYHSGGFKVEYPDGKEMQASYVQAQPASPPFDPNSQAVALWIKDLNDSMEQVIAWLVVGDSASLAHLHQQEIGLSEWEKYNKRMRCIAYLIHSN